MALYTPLQRSARYRVRNRQRIREQRRATYDPFPRRLAYLLDKCVRAAERLNGKGA